MKSIQVITDSTYFTVFDRDEEDVSNYSRKLTNILDSQKVVILHTSEQSVILRPNKIVSIIVSEVPEQDLNQIGVQQAQEISNINPTENPEQNIETKSSSVEEDVITDMD
jgi:archaellum biogenesis ATPase FlaH